MKALFNKKDVLTVPNLLSVVRLLLIPLIIWFYAVRENRLAAISVIVLSGITDVVDGYIARHFNMVSDLGKILDPFADKLTQGIVAICLITEYPLMLPIVIFFVVKELIMSVLGLLCMKKKDLISGAKWYGKANTFFLYTVMSCLILFPNMPDTLVTVLIILCGAAMLISLLLYVRFYIKQITGERESSELSRDAADTSKEL